MLDGYERILVTGGLGFIGGHLVDALLSLGKEVVVLDNTSTAIPPAPSPNAGFVLADIRHQDQVEKAAMGTELAFHLAGNANGTLSVTDPSLDFGTNALGTLNVAQSLLLAGARRFVYLSSASVYGRPQRVPIDEDHPTRPFLPYGASKLAGEVVCSAFQRTYGLPVVVARAFCVYGAGENPRSTLVEVSRYLRWHLNARPIQVVGDPDRKTRDFIHVSDVVNGLLLLAERGEEGEIFNLGSGEEVSMRQLTEFIGATNGRRAIIKEIPEVGDDTYRLVADISKLKSLGFRPQKSLKEEVLELADQLGDNPELPSEVTIFRPHQQAENVRAQGG